MTYRVELTPGAARSFRKLDPVAQRRVQAAIDLLADNPRPPSAKIMAGQPPGTFRVRTGDYRIVYEVHDDLLVVLVIRIGHRREVYKSR